MQTVSKFIDKLGGTVAVANALGITPSTVSSWKGADSIPSWRMPGIMALAEQQGAKVPARFTSKRAA